MSDQSIGRDRAGEDGQETHKDPSRASRYTSQASTAPLTHKNPTQKPAGVVWSFRFGTVQEPFFFFELNAPEVH
jgi:hypothetical protein